MHSKKHIVKLLARIVSIGNTLRHKHITLSYHSWGLLGTILPKSIK